MAKKRKTTDAVKILHKRYIKDIEDRRMLQQAREQSDVASQIYRLRQKAGLSQKALAGIVGTTQSVISQLEDADYEGHSLKMLRRIANALNCELEVYIISHRKRHYARTG
jgi:ribosome-binding protein aMBF1 (putative translation factor)